MVPPRIWAPFALVSFVESFAGARDLWVGKQGCDDARDVAANSEATPWCTLKRAHAETLPGDTVHVHEGNYSDSGDSVLRISRSGTAGHPIRYVAVPGENVEITPDGGAAAGITMYDPGVAFVEIEGFHVRDFSDQACIYLDTAEDIVLRGLEVSGCKGRNSLGSHLARRFTIESCRLHDNATHAWGSTVGLWVCREGNVVRGNMIWNNQDDPWDTCGEGCGDTEGHGIILDSCETAAGTIIENNVIWGQEGMGIVVFRSDATAEAPGLIRNNTLVRNSLRPQGGELSIAGSHYEIFNNVMVPRENEIGLLLMWGPYSSVQTDPTSLREGGNIAWAPSHTGVFAWGGTVGTVDEFKAQTATYGYGERTQQVDPGFAGMANNDFRPSAASAVVDAGVSGKAASVDITGASRPADGNGDGVLDVDVGAYEFGAVGGDGGAFAGQPPGVATGGSADGTEDGGGATASNADDSAGAGACGCRVGGARPWGSTPGLLLLGVSAWLVRRWRLLQR